MKLSIRKKFFIVLLAFSLGPNLIMRGVMGKAVNEGVQALSGEVRAELRDIVTQELEHNAVSILRTVEGGGQALTLGVRVLAQEAQRLMQAVPTSDSGPPLFSIDFADPEAVPEDAVAVSGYERLTMGGKRRPTRISLGSPSFHAPQGVAPGMLAQDILHLQGMTPTFRSVFDELGGKMLWGRVALASGALLTYPGHGGFPMMYDHRDQEWYKQVRRTEREAWTTPLIDPTTRQVVATVASPVLDAAGRFIGVASIDTPLAAVLHEADLRSRWSGDIRSFMVTRYPGETVERDGLLILGQRAYSEERLHWRTGIEQEWMTSDDPEAYKKFLVAMAGSDVGHMRLPHDGIDCIWAWASTEFYSFILIAPVSVISQLPDQVSGSVDSLFDNIARVSFIVSGVMLVVIGFIAWFGSKTFTKPLLAMADAARRLSGGDFSVRIHSRYGDERDTVVQAFNAMGPKLDEHMRLSKDLELAREVQRLLLPHAEPDLDGFDISGGIAYCDQTGGDYYDFIEVQSDGEPALAVILGDVSGHGVPSALIMAAARSQLHILAEASMRPEERVAAINHFLAQDLDGTGRFLTLFYLRLRKGESKVRWVRAGQDPAIRYTPDTDRFSELGGDGIALGVLPDFYFQGYDAELSPGEIIVLSTDGVWEAWDDGGEMFGKQRMLAIVRENAHKNAEGIRTALMDAVAAFQGAGQQDDIAVVVVKKL